MKAARIHAYGGPEVLVVEDAPEPTFGPGDVLVEVHATSVNPIDCKIRSGAYRGGIRYRLPRALGMDVSGVVREVGAQVTRWKPGDAVWASPNHKTPGTYAELTVVRQAELGRKPANLTHAEAASLPLVALTAWQALVDVGRVTAGERVLVQAGSGGVGSAAIQLAKQLGAWVATTCSAANADLVRDLGADRVIDYRAEAFDEVLEGLDLVVDMLGTEALRRARGVLRRGGRLVGVAPGLPDRVRRWGPYLGLAAMGLTMVGHRVGSRCAAGVSTRFVTRSPLGVQLDHLADLCEQGALRPVIDRILPLEAIADAHRHSETGRARGKIVIAVR